MLKLITMGHKVDLCFIIDLLQMNPSDRFMLAANSVHEVEVGVRPLTVGCKFMYINVVGILYYKLLPYQLRFITN